MICHSFILPGWAEQLRQTDPGLLELGEAVVFGEVDVVLDVEGDQGQVAGVTAGSNPGVVDWAWPAAECAPAWIWPQREATWLL
jgi:hypothetical protein